MNRSIFGRSSGKQIQPVHFTVGNGGLSGSICRRFFKFDRFFEKPLLAVSMGKQLNIIRTRFSINHDLHILK